MKIVKTLRKIEYKGMVLSLVLRAELFMNAAEPLIMTRVIAPNGGNIPIRIEGRETQKSIISKCLDFLKGMETSGYDVKKELTKKLK